ncbi:MAG: hypothetical protein QOE70_5871 [Chthoniobacter sp.]|jgi:hypothetical protein|nr:hypothetical protein [Chthoniobacter sp.]
MRQIKLSGREQAVIRSIDYASGSTGAEIRERLQMEPSDLCELLHSLCDVGYLEPFPFTDIVTFANFATLRFEVNPAYAQDLKIALRRR